MPRFMIEINREAFALLELEAKADRRTIQDQAGILLEQMLQAKADADATYIEVAEPDPVAATAADPSGDAHKPR